MSKSPDRNGARFRVVEVTTSIAGAACGRLFAALGHEVVRYAPADRDPLRESEFVFTAVNAGKSSVELLPGSEARQLAVALADADVLISDLHMLAATRVGLTPAEVAERYPRLVTVSLTAVGFGYNSDAPDLPSDSLLAESFGGLATMIGEPQQRPLSLGGEQAAHAAAFVGFYGACLALRGRESIGKGDFIDVALSDVAAYLDWKSDVSFQQGGVAPRRTGASQGGWRIVRAQDGWVGVIFLPNQWPQLVELIGDSRLSDPDLRDARTRSECPELWWPIVCDAIGRRNVQDVYREAQRLGLPFGYAATVADVLNCEQLLGRGFVLPADERRRDEPVVRLPVSIVRAADSACAAEPGDDLAKKASAPQAASEAKPRDLTSPLEGVLVLDFGMITAGAAAGRLLADYGATVIKIESKGRPDPFRQWITPAGTARQGGSETSPVFSSNNVGKRGLCIDMKTPRGQKIMAGLIKRADVLVENFRVGVTSRMGMDYEAVHALNPDLVYLSLSSQGLSGPESTYSSYGSTLDLLSGLAASTGYSAGAPLWSSGEVNYPDQVVSLFGAAMVTHALVTGQKGVHLDISQREVVAWTLADQLAEYAWTGQIARPNGNRRRGSTPHDTYPAAETDTWLAIACSTDAHRQALAELIDGLPDDVSEPAWRTLEDHVDERITAWTRTRTRDQAVRELTAAGVPAVAVCTAKDRAERARYRERRVGLFESGWLKGFPMVMRRYQPPTPAPAPALGEDIQDWDDESVERFIDQLISGVRS